MDIANLTIADITYDVAEFPDDAADIIKLLPKQLYQKISFHLLNANTPIANAIRRVIIEELNIKCLDFELKNLDTNEVYIIPDELHDKINFIPLHQDVGDVTFSLNVSNTSANLLTVRAGDLTADKDAGMKIEDLVPASYILTVLRPGKYINLTKIKIISGYGYIHSRFFATSTYEYSPIDFISVAILNEKCNFVKKIVHVVDVIKLLKDYKNLGKTTAGVKFDKFNLFQQKILIIPNKNYLNLLTSFQKKRFDNYDIVLQNTEGYALDTIDDNTFIKTYNAANSNCKDYYLSFTTYGNIDPRKMMLMCFDNLKQRLIDIQKTFAEINAANDNQFIDEMSDDNDALNKDKMIMIQDSVKTTILIRGEDYTISKLLTKTIYNLDPNIGFINDPLEHPSNRTAMFNIIHPEPVKIFNDALTTCIGYMDLLTKLFTK